MDFVETSSVPSPPPAAPSSAANKPKRPNVLRLNGRSGGHGTDLDQKDALLKSPASSMDTATAVVVDDPAETNGQLDSVAAPKSSR